MSHKINGKRVCIVLDEDTLILEEIYKKQCKELDHAVHSRSNIGRHLLRQYYRSNTLAIQKTGKPHSDFKEGVDFSQI